MHGGHREEAGNELTGKVTGIAMKVHNLLGPGLLESVYQESLYYYLRKEGIEVKKQFPVPLSLEGVELECGYRIDLLIEDKLVIEIKLVEALHDVHLAQILTYLKLDQFILGLLINFNVLKLNDGIRRVIN